MKKIIRLSIVVCLLISIPFSQALCQDNDVIVKGNLRYLVLEGSPYERGVQHGTKLKKEIHELMKVWKTDIQKTYKMDPEMFISEFTRKTDFISSIKIHTPNILEELKGIADGAGIDFNTMYAFQLVDEFWVIGPELVQNRCTSFGVKKSKKNPGYTAQTLDIPFFHGYQTLLHMKDPKDNMETFLLTFPGFVGANGMNDRPVSVCVDELKFIFSNRDCNINNRSTFSCTIMVLSEHPELHITGGRPDENPFLLFRFE